MKPITAAGVCPVCAHEPTEHLLTARDHTVTGEAFQLDRCPQCGLVRTMGAPSPETIGAYYRSEDYISHTNRSAGLIGALYKLARWFTLASKRRLVRSASGRWTARLLDVGCGTGAFAHTMVRAGWEVTGLEPDASARENAKRLYGFKARPIEDLALLPTESFDVITLWHVLEHVYDPDAYLERFHQLLHHHGVLIIAVPNPAAADALHYGANWAAWDVPRHLFHYTPEAMEKLAHNHGFEVEQIRRMWLDAWYIALLSERYATGHTRWLHALWQGLRATWAALWNRRKCSSLIYVMRMTGH